MNSPESIKEFYDIRGNEALSRKKSSSIAEHLSAPYDALYKEIESYVERHPGKQINVLDIGCGIGTHSIHIAKLAPSVFVTAIDLSEASINAATRFNEHENINYLLVPAESFLASSSTEFDIIFTSGALYYFDVKKFLNLAWNRLSATGLFLCVETNRLCLPVNIYRRLKCAISKHRDLATLNHLIAPHELEGLDIFSKTKIQAFDFFTLLFPVIKTRSQEKNNSLIQHLKNLDSWLFKYKFTRMWCFKFLFVGRK